MGGDTAKIHLHIMLSPEDSMKLSQEAKRCGLTKTALLCRLINGVELRPSREQEVKKLIAEVNKIGSNVNQIARSANSGMLSEEQVHRLDFMMGEIYKLVNRIAVE